MVLGKLPVPGRPTIWMVVGQGPIALAVGAGGVVWTFWLSSILSLICSLSLGGGGGGRYRLKCLTGPLNQKQTNKQDLDLFIELPLLRWQSLSLSTLMVFSCLVLQSTSFPVTCTSKRLLSFGPLCLKVCSHSAFFVSCEDSLFG